MAAKTYFPYQKLRGFSGVAELSLQGIKDTVNLDSYGVYLLLYRNGSGYLVAYVGRGDLRARLRRHIRDTDATHFVAKEMIDDDEVGFKEECRLYHHYGKSNHLDNENHPDVPDGSGDDYPRCSKTDCNGERY